MSGGDTTATAQPPSAELSHLDGDQATVASQDTYRSYRSYDSRKSRGYPTDPSNRRRREDDRHYSRDQSRSRDPSTRRREPSRSRDRSVSQPRSFGGRRVEGRSTDRHESMDNERFHRAESYAPSAERERVYQNKDRRDFRRGRSSSVTSARSEAPFKRGRRFGSVSKSRSPGRLIGRSLPRETIEWPPSFDSDGTAFVFHPASGMFYEENSEFFYDPRTKLYYGAKKGAYFRYDDSRDPPFVEAQRVDPTQGTPTEPLEPPVILPPINGSPQSAGDKPKIAIKLKTKKIKKPKVAINTEAPKATPIPASRVQKEQVANIEKWTEKQAELKSFSALPMPVSAAAAIEEIKRTVKGEPICVLCKRKFLTIEKLRLHENMSELHKSNLAKRALLGREKRKVEDTASAEKQQYNDRAEKRRHLHGPDGPTSSVASFAPSGVVSRPPAPEVLDENNVGNKLLQKMGWQAGANLGKKGADDGSDKSSREIRKDWDRIEAMASNGSSARSNQ